MLWQTTGTERHIVLHGTAVMPTASFGYNRDAENTKQAHLDPGGGS